MYEPTAMAPRPRATFAAIIAHADDPDLLRRCIAHHLRIGVDWIFVSLNLDDPESAAVPREFDQAKVHAERLASFANDHFDYFTEALRAATRRAAADWVFFVDSDEFWVPASGCIGETAGLEQADVLSVRRFNVPPVRTRDGAIRDVQDPAAAIVIRTRHVMDAAFLAQHPEIPFVAAKIGPKVMVRPELVASVAIGAHDITPRSPGVRSMIPVDLMVVHFPFTTPSRFHRKIEDVRRMLTRHADRYTGTLAWHWRRWVAVADAGGADAEYAAQFIDEADVADLLARGTLTTPSRLFAEKCLACE